MAKRTYTTLPWKEEAVADNRFDTTRITIDRIVLHTTVGSAQSAISLFASKPQPGKETSAHYMVKKDGTLIAFLEEYNTAYHCGNYAFNKRSIGIEHEDGGDYNDIRPDTLYTMSAKLVADICQFYSIPCDKTHIVRHHDVSGASTACPDALDTDRIIREAAAILSPPPATPPTIRTPEDARYIKQLEDAVNVKDKKISELEKILSDTQASLKITTETLNSVNQLVNEKNNQIAQIQSQISTLNSQLLNVTERANSLEEQAIQMPGLKEQIEELERQRVIWRSSETNFKKQITLLKNENDALKKNWLKGLLESIIGPLFKRG